MDWWRTFSVTLQYLNIWVDAGMIGLFFRPFLFEKKKAKWISLAYIIAMTVIFPIPWDNWMVQPTLVGICAVAIVSILVERENIYQKIFLTVTSYLIAWIANGLSLLPWNYLWDIWEKIALSDKVINSPYNEVILSSIYVVTNVSNLFFIALCLFIMIKTIHKVYVQKHAFMDKHELMFLLSPYLSVISGYFIIRFMLKSYERDTSQYFWTVHEGYFGLFCLFQLLSLLTIIAEITIYQKIMSKNEDELANALLEEQVKDVKAHISQVEELYSNIRGLKHDLNNHIQILSDLHNKGAYEDAERYLHELKEDFNAVDLEVKTKNPVTDIIILQKMKEAEALNIDFEQAFAFPAQGNISAYDMSIILSNTLSNAIEAASVSRDKKVELKSKIRGQLFFIEIVNSFDGSLQIDEVSGLPVSKKQESGLHGQGLKNVKKVVEKYYGDISIDDKDEFIDVTVMLVIPFTDENGRLTQ